MTSRRVLPALLLLFIGSGCAAPHLRNRLVPVTPAGDRLVGDFAGSAPGHVHGRNVSGQLRAVIRRAGAASSAARLRVPRAGHRAHRPARARRHAARQRRLHVVGRIGGRRARCSAA